ncbi:MFS transporter [Streptomyces yerevanensis]|uniref:MFS transporter n=1 Tax=Streptomyces yerevanensis TaxID=66378 RepID=UPI000B1A5D00|nr:MFS transporter [Streptomyces yerevanensis]
MGLLLANLAFLLSRHTLDDNWAWRVPFLLSAVLIAVGIFIRLKIDESPQFEELKESGQVVKNRLLEVIRKDWRNVLRAFCLRITETAGYAVSVTFVLFYLDDDEAPDVSGTTSLTALVTAAVLGVAATTLWARLSDRVGRRPVYLFGCVVSVRGNEMFDHGEGKPPGVVPVWRVE